MKIVIQIIIMEDYERARAMEQHATTDGDDDEDDADYERIKALT